MGEVGDEAATAAELTDSWWDFRPLVPEGDALQGP